MHILPDQVRAYRGVYQSREAQPAVTSFGDVVTAQQTLTATINNYLSALSAQWTAVVDVAHLLQTDDLFGVAEETVNVTPVPCLEHAPPLPCAAPVDPGWHESDGSWPAPAPGKEKP